MLLQQMPNQAGCARAAFAFSVELGFQRDGKSDTSYIYVIDNTLVCQSGVCLYRQSLLHSGTVTRKASTKDVGAINIRDVPKDLLHRVKLAAAVERRSVKGFLLALAEERIQDLEKKGLMPKGK
jgi:hypothetical protein